MVIIDILQLNICQFKKMLCIFFYKLMVCSSTSKDNLYRTVVKENILQNENGLSRNPSFIIERGLPREAW